MIVRFVALCAVCACALAALPAARAGDDLPHPRQKDLGPSDRLEALIERVRLAQASVETLESEFVQLKESAMLVEPVEATGVFFFSAPDRVRWEYETPDPITVLIVDDEMTTWYRDIQRAERVSVGRQSQRVLEFLGAGSSMEELLEYFSLTLTLPDDPSEPYVLELTPRFDKVAKRIRGMTVWVDPEDFLPARLRYLETDGDITDFRFSRLRINAGVSEERFRLEMPKNVEVRHVELDRPAGPL